MAEKTNFCVSTVVTADHFQHYIPIFVYTLNRAVPDVDIVIHINGVLDEFTLGALSVCNLIGKAKFVKLSYSGKVCKSTFNSLRFCIAVDYDYTFLTDIDFIFMPHEPSFDKYYIKKLANWGQSYWGMRGPKKNGLKRIRGGAFLATRKWWDDTKDVREEMMRKIMTGEIGKVREDDETMLWQICAKSNLVLPTKKGNKRRSKYREVHIGDFKFPNRWTNMRKMGEKITKANMYKWYLLQKDAMWLEVRKICERDANVKKMLKNIDTYMAKRKRWVEERIAV